VQEQQWSALTPLDQIQAGSRDRYCPVHGAGIGQGVDPRRDVDAVAIEVLVLDDHVPEVDATAEASEGTITS
jgi:hypothetical protein